MKQAFRSWVVVFVALFGAVGLAIASAFTAALAYGAVALIVPGTGTPNANIVDAYLTQARDRYLTTTACGADGSGCPVGPNLQGINYPASFFPLAIIPGWCTPSRCNTWDDSVGQGTANLNAAIDAALVDPKNADGKVVVFGYSQGGAVVADSLAGHIAGLTDAQKARIQVVTIGGIENPDGGLWQRLSFLQYIPLLNISFNPPMLPNTGVNYTSYGFQYDPVVNAPRYFGNPFAVLNALAAFENVHGYYLAPNGNDPTGSLPYGYDDDSLASAIDCASGTNPNCRKDTYGNTYVTIPALTLPIYNLILDETPAALRPLVQPIVNLLTPVTRLLIDLGYDTTGNPGVPTPLSVLPFNPATFNPVDFSVKFVAAIVQGIQDAIHGVPTTTLRPAATTTPSTLAVRSIVPQPDVAAAAEVSGTPATVTDLASKRSAPVEAAPLQNPLDAVDVPGKTVPAVTDPAVTPDSTPADATVAPDKTVEPQDANETKTDAGTKTDADTKTDEVTTDETKKDETKKDETKKDETKKDETKKDESKKDETATPDAVKKDEPSRVEQKSDTDHEKHAPKKDAGETSSDPAKKDAA